MSRKKRKPWDETWHAVIGGHTGGCDKWREGKWTFSAVDGKPGWCTDGQQPGYGIPGNVARLAAAAPDLVRALLAVEYDSAVGYDGELHVCPWCDGMDPAREYVRYDGVTTSAHYGVRVGHAPDCQRQAALRKAGVID